MADERNYTFTDQCLLHFDQVLHTLFVPMTLSGRRNPAAEVEEVAMTTAECTHAAGLMRVDHAGEVCAQALYQGQAITARDVKIKDKMRQAALEESDHLHWCEQRLHELNSQTSYLNPLWYTLSLCVGLIAGLASDQLNLGFVAETERQVVKHLDQHLDELPLQDNKSRIILKQMREDEQQHATMAIDAGAAELPAAVKRLMQMMSRVMTLTTYWI